MHQVVRRVAVMRSTHRLLHQSPEKYFLEYVLGGAGRAMRMFRQLVIRQKSGFPLRWCGLRKTLCRLHQYHEQVTPESLASLLHQRWTAPLHWVQ